MVELGSVVSKAVEDGAAAMPSGEAGAAVDNGRARRVAVEWESESDASVDNEGQEARGDGVAAAATISSPRPVSGNSAAGATKPEGEVRNDFGNNPRNGSKNDGGKGPGPEEEHGGRTRERESYA